MRPYTETRASDEDTFEQRSLLTDQDDLEGGNQVVGKPLRTSSSKPTGRLERLLNRIDQRWSVKKLKRTWGPRLESVVRLMLVATFFDDSLRASRPLARCCSCTCAGSTVRHALSGCAAQRCDSRAAAKAPGCHRRWQQLCWLGWRCHLAASSKACLQ